MQFRIIGDNPWYNLSAGAFLSGLFLLLQDQGLRDLALAHDLATLGALHLYALTLIALAGFLRRRDAEDAWFLGSLAHVIRYLPFAVQLILFARRETLAMPIALVNFILFCAETELLARALMLEEGLAARVAQMAGMAGPALLLPFLIRPGEIPPDPRLVEGAWLWVAAGLAAFIATRRRDPERPEFDLAVSLLYVVALPASLLAPMAVGLLTARAVVLLPAFMAGVTFMAIEIAAEIENDRWRRAVMAIPGIVAGIICAVAWWDGYAVLFALPLPFVLSSWSVVIGFAAQRNKVLMIGGPTGALLRGACKIGGGPVGEAASATWRLVTMNLGWVCIALAFAFLAPGVMRSLKEKEMIPPDDKRSS